MTPTIKEDAVIINYENWRQHPITTELVKNLEKIKQEFYTNVVNDCIKIGKVTDQEYRHNGIAIRQIETCIQLCTNYNAFRTQLNK